MFKERAHIKGTVSRDRCGLKSTDGESIYVRIILEVFLKLSIAA
jgi:hypothetical protein